MLIIPCRERERLLRLRKYANRFQQVLCTVRSLLFQVVPTGGIRRGGGDSALLCCVL